MHSALATVHASVCADLFADAPPTARQPCSSDPLGFEIGWDHAHYRLVPPVEHLHPGHPVRQGWQAGQAVFGTRTLKATPQVRKWLQLRLNAWRRGRAFETVQVTPHFLAQIDVPVCPITRETLSHGSLGGSDASVDRVCNRAGYAAGNLAVMSARANQAKADHDWDEALAFVRRIEAGGLPDIEGLDAVQWSRLAVLMSFVTPLPHAEAACLPLLVLPPQRLRVLNAVQALQVLLTLRIMRAGARLGVAELAAALPVAARHDFQVLMLTLQARRLAAGGNAQGLELRQAMEDAWQHPMLNRRWQRLALQLTELDCERMVQRLARRGGKAQGWQWLPRAAATEGWALADAGYAGPRPAWAGAKPPVKRVARLPYSSPSATRASYSRSSMPSTISDS